ncbi:Serine/threonine protein kinase [Handroanthus impetiginosus]|uniref:Serine/threonine protein kinase n=1 Tax=Handroanthus impetiginosus TaxID=429701 RepID=A0A2G9HRY9_9LAMI|nr:Serine/threonine protein kinase [Handroanthus impetiginosus]
MDAKFLYFLSFNFSIFIFTVAFTPQDNCLIISGSSKDNVLIDNRLFIGDLSKKISGYLSEGKSFAVKNPSTSSNSSGLHSSARIFTSASSYRFKIKNVGTHLVRLHFYPFVYGNYDLRNGNFSVLANGLYLLSNFGVESPVMKEFFLMVDKFGLDIMFLPSNFAFVNGIEVFSVPKDLFLDDDDEIPLISDNGIQEFNNITSYVLETVYRVNVGGSIITPFNDTLWRTWIPDEDFLVLKSASKVITTLVPPNYQPGGANRDHAPDNVYMTAREMNVANGSWTLFNITWDFPVSSEDDTYFVRLHFCDIVSVSLNMLYFDIYINGIIAYKDVDLSVLAFHELASPYYIDFVVKNKKDSDVVRISVGPSELSTLRKNAILNGVEIMRIVNVVVPRQKFVMKRIWILVVCVVGGFFALSLSVLAIFAVFKYRKRKQKPRRTESGTISEGITLASPGSFGYYGWKIPFADIQLATKNFDKNLIIGSGGFGVVYKGVLTDNNKVAVKRGVPGSRQGLPEFQTEITVLSRIRHCHLVSLIGYCEEQSEMILVYEYMDKGTLRQHLYGSNSSPLSWKQRLEICIGAARGLHYLHTGFAQGIIHRDIKSTNILLDENYIAKVADFGLSRSGPCLNESHVSTGVKGSFGYLDPEYFRRQQLTDKSDVYSFGVVLLEVLCSKPAVDPLREQLNLAEWAMEWIKKGLVMKIVDPRLVGQIKPSCLKKFGETAEKCLSEYAVDRPTMGDVLWNLERAYQLQMNEQENEQDEMGSRRVVPEVPSMNVDANAENNRGNSEVSTSGVFSQLITRKGR